jgi:hypothetical protein
MSVGLRLPDRRGGQSHRASDVMKARLIDGFLIDSNQTSLIIFLKN